MQGNVADNANRKTYVDSAVVWNSVQDWRVKSNLKPYTEDPKLCKIADKRLVELLELTENGYPISHASFEKDGQTYLKELNARYIGENLAHLFLLSNQDDSEYLKAWLNSKVHRELLENTDFTNSCLKCSKTICIQVFASY